MRLKYKVPLLFLAIGVVIVICTGISYAYWKLSFSQKEEKILVSDCFMIEFTDQNPITLTSAYPITEEGALNTMTPYQFTIKNQCSSMAHYQINLESLILENSSKRLSDEYVNLRIEDITNASVTSYQNLSEERTPTLTEADKAYKLLEGKLTPKQTKTFQVYIWIGYDIPVIEEVTDATWKGKITMTTTYSEEEYIENLMQPFKVITGGTNNLEYFNTTYSQNEIYHVSNVIYESVKNPYENAIAVVDFSEYQNQSVLGYYLLNEDGTYNLHIQADGKIRINPKSSYFGTEVVVEGIENIDTSYVKDMSNMFLQNKNTTLDLSNFDTSNVIWMSNMFQESLNLTTLNISSFYTANVLLFNQMFIGANNLTTIIYGDTFIKNEQANIDLMYENCPANKPTHSSWDGVIFE